MYNVIAIYGYPVHYTAPMFKQISRDNEIDLTVVYCKTAEYDKPQYDKDGDMVIGDVKVLDGYKYHFLKELIHAKTPAPHKLINPEAVAVYPEGIQIITNAVRWAVPVSRTDELVCLGVTDTAGSRE